jgi:hypothetical protein
MEQNGNIRLSKGGFVQCHRNARSILAADGILCSFTAMRATLTDWSTSPHMAVAKELAVVPRRKPAEDVKTPPRPAKGTGLDLHAFHKLMTKRFPKILAELAK